MLTYLATCCSIYQWPLFGLMFFISVVLKSRFWLQVALFHKFPLSKIPGPRIAAWTRLWIVKVLATGRAHETWVDINEEYGSLARTGPNHLITNDPAVIKELLSVRSEHKKGPWFDSHKTDPFLDNVVSTTDPKRHARLRAKLAPGFKVSIAKESETAVDKIIIDWISRIKRLGSSFPDYPYVIDLGEEVKYLTLDLITKILLGSEIGHAVDKKHVDSFLSDVKTGSSFLKYFTVLTELNSVMKWMAILPGIGRYVRAEPENPQGIGRLMSFISMILKDRQTLGRRKDVVSSLLSNGMTEREISSEVLVALVAGSDTTSTAVQHTIMAVMTNPQVYYTLKAEIGLSLDRIVNSSVISIDESKQLPYLTACIMESLRLHPPLGSLNEREVGGDGDVFSGYFVPAGTYIGLNIRGAQLRKDIYGPDAGVFRPERWFERDPYRLKAMHQTHELIFSYGATRCLGYDIAMMEITKLVFEVFRNFELSIARPERPWQSICHGPFFQKDFNVVVHPAKSAPPSYTERAPSSFRFN